ncbi:MAG: hypothetical protein KDD25_04580 [Bdellovibrionales bacterium]|nr:hypothetical protein [Bdellovibrionales bacterium]
MTPRLFGLLVPICLIATLMSSDFAQATEDRSVISLAQEPFDGSFSYFSFTKKVRQQFDIPYFFNIPYTSFAPLSPEILESKNSSDPYPVLVYNYRETNKWRHTFDPELDIGLRIFGLNRERPRKENSARLARTGILKNGDILLSFRPEWFETLKYSHIQLGVSHAGMVYIDRESDGKDYVKNLDMPMDSHTSGEGYLNSEHYLGANALHIIRPKGLSDEQRNRIGDWLKLMNVNARKAYAKGDFRFNKDYASPNYSEENKYGHVANLARMALGLKPTETTQMYCSEFAWSVLSLKDCDPKSEELKTQLASGESPSCINAIFEPMPVLGSITTDEVENESTTVGMADGIPLVTSVVSKNFREYDKKIQNKLTDRLISLSAFLFSNEHPENISSGHRAVEEALTTADPKFFDRLKTYYHLLNDEGAGQNQTVLAIRSGINAGQKRNYSPTAFKVQAILPYSSSSKRMEYVGTISFSPEDSKLYESLLQMGKNIK